MEKFLNEADHMRGSDAAWPSTCAADKITQCLACTPIHLCISRQAGASEVCHVATATGQQKRHTLSWQATWSSMMAMTSPSDISSSMPVILPARSGSMFSTRGYSSSPAHHPHVTSRQSAQQSLAMHTNGKLSVLQRSESASNIRQFDILHLCTCSHHKWLCGV